MMPAPRVTTDEYLRGAETLLPQELVYSSGVLPEFTESLATVLG
jgi:hypothetical protein